MILPSRAGADFRHSGEASADPPVPTISLILAPLPRPFWIRSSICAPAFLYSHSFTKAHLISAGSGLESSRIHWLGIADPALKTNSLWFFARSPPRCRRLRPLRFSTMWITTIQAPPWGSDPGLCLRVPCCRRQKFRPPVVPPLRGGAG